MMLNAQQHALAVDIGDLQRDDLGYAQARAIGDAERRPIFYAGGGREKSSHLLRAQNDRRPARLGHQRQTPDQIVAFERHFEKEPQRDVARQSGWEGGDDQKRILTVAAD